MSTTACDDQFAPELVANQRVRLPDGSIARVIAALGNGLYKVAEPDKPAYITTSDNIYHREDLETTMSNNANDILLAAAGHMTDRAATYDKPQGERSMAATVDAFRATTGIELTEEQGWHFMCLLKLVRSQQGGYRADNYEDLTAYAALTGEAAANSRL